MSIRRELREYNLYTATHRERGSVYIDTLSGEALDTAILLAEPLQRVSQSLEKTAVIIPVAAHQDSGLIVPAMAEYAKQQGNAPFSIVLGLNAPMNDFDNQVIQDAEAEVEKARSLFPHLDIRSTSNSYDSATIGRIRRDIWNATFLLAFHENGLENDVIGINNDIDTVFISPHYISRIQEHYKKGTKRRSALAPDLAKNAIQLPGGTRLSHAKLPSHPNVARVTSWTDNTAFQAPGHIAYEAGMVIPFSWYADRLGFDEDSVTHETAWVSSGLNQKLSYISGAQLYTSPRRYIDRLQDHGVDEIWTTDSFGVSDKCRDEIPKDISFQRAEEIIFDRLDADLHNAWLLGGMYDITSKKFDEYLDGATLDVSKTIAETTLEATRQHEKARRFLMYVVGSPLLAELAGEAVDVEQYVDFYIKDMEGYFNEKR